MRRAVRKSRVRCIQAARSGAVGPLMFLLFSGLLMAAQAAEGQDTDDRCGNGRPDRAEACDDGNVIDGDGCSATCRIEPGFSCTAAIGNIVDDAVANGDFETTGGWTFASSTFASPVCTTDLCGADGLNRPAGGHGWVWLGGTLGNETASMSQPITLRQTDTTLSVDLAVPNCETPSDSLAIFLDGNPVLVVPGDDGQCGDPGYQQRTVDLASAPGGPYNDGLAHTLRIEAQTQSVSDRPTSFFVDNVSVARSVQVGTPSACAPIANACSTQSFEDLIAGDPASLGWTTFGVSAGAAPWGASDDGVCHSANAVAGNSTGGQGRALCVDSDASGPGLTDSAVCTPAMDLRGRTGSGASVLVNYQVFGESDEEDALEILAGIAAPNAATIEGYTQLMRLTDSAGARFRPPGEQVIVDLSAFDGLPEVYTCLRYRGNFDWSAQLDQFTTTADNCGGDDSDADGVLNSVDNCTSVANADQTDSNGDGYGNACDADVAGPLGVGMDDCIVNILDLGAMRAAFQSTPADANWNPDVDLGGPDGQPDGQINIVDLGRLRVAFFGAPGPGLGGCK